MEPLQAVAPAPDNDRRAGAILLAENRATDAMASGFDPLWATLAGMPLLAWSIAAFERVTSVSEIVVVVAAQRLSDTTALAAKLRWERVHILEAATLRRRDSLQHSLDAFSPEIGWIVIHDAARPLVTPGLITAGLNAVAASDAAAASISVNETLKRARHGVVVETPTRAQLVQLQTPQVFSRAVLLAACERAPSDLDPPDAATLAVASGFHVALFPGSPENMSVTTGDDLALAEALLVARAQERDGIVGRC